MSFGKLLTTGKSWGVKPGGRYRVNKLAQLPKFNSPKNPFASSGRADAVGEAVSAAPLVTPEPVRVENPIADPSGKSSVPRIDFVVPKLANAVAHAPRVIGAHAVRAARLLGEWGQKLNPLPLLARRRGPTRSAVNNFKPPAIQTELSLDTVKVVRNDLSDADLEVVLVTKPIAPDQNEQLVMASVGGRERGSLNRLSSWMFGAKSS